MILLEVHNRIIEELLTTQIETFLRKEKLVEIKTTVLGKYSSEESSKNQLHNRSFRIRWCTVLCHMFKGGSIHCQY